MLAFLRGKTVIRNHVGLRKGRLQNGLLSLMTLLMLSLAVGCNQSNTNQGTATEQSPTAQSAAQPSVQQPKTKVVATILPMYLFTKAVAGDAADVELLIPPNVDVHEYQGTPANVQAIAQADILVKNGLGLEEFLTDIVKNAQNSKLKEINASAAIKPVNEISPVVKATKSEHSHDHNHAEGNPHVWLDPVLAKQQVTNIRDGLITADPANQATYEANAAAYIQELENLNNEFQQTLQKTPNCTFVTFHDAYPYLAQRYNLKQVAVVEIPEDQLSPADVQNTINAVRKYNVKALFGEPGIDNKLLKSLSQDLKLTLRSLNTLESGEQNPQYYFEAMRSNLQNLAAACQ